MGFKTLPPSVTKCLHRLQYWSNPSCPPHTQWQSQKLPGGDGAAGLLWVITVCAVVEQIREGRMGFKTPPPSVTKGLHRLQCWSNPSCPPYTQWQPQKPPGGDEAAGQWVITVCAAVEQIREGRMGFKTPPPSVTKCLHRLPLLEFVLITCICDLFYRYSYCVILLVSVIDSLQLCVLQLPSKSQVIWISID